MPRDTAFAYQKPPTDTIYYPTLRPAIVHLPNNLHHNDAVTCIKFSRATTFRRRAISNSFWQRKRAYVSRLGLKMAARPTTQSSTNIMKDKSTNTTGAAPGSPRIAEFQMASRGRSGSRRPTAKIKYHLSSTKSRWRKFSNLFKVKRATVFTPTRSTFVDTVAQENHVHGMRDPVKDNDEWPASNWSTASTDAYQHPGAQVKQGVDNALLQIDIPDIELERYSVMFDGLLCGKPSPVKNSKILPPVNMSSVSQPKVMPLHKVPSFTLFPATNNGKASEILGIHSIPPGSPLIQSLVGGRIKKKTRQCESLQAFRQTSSPIPPSQQSGTLFFESDQRIQPRYRTPSDDYKINSILPNHSSPAAPRADMKGRSFLSVSNQSEGSSASITGTISSTSISGTTTSSIRSAPKAKDGHPLSESLAKHFGDDDSYSGSTKQGMEMPVVQVSVARSVSVSKRKGQTVVAIGRRTDSPRVSGLLSERMLKAPLFVGGGLTHGYEESQAPRIETM